MFQSLTLSHTPTVHLALLGHEAAETAVETWQKKIKETRQTLRIFSAGTVYLLYSLYTVCVCKAVVACIEIKDIQSCVTTYSGIKVSFCVCLKLSWNNTDTDFFSHRLKFVITQSNGSSGDY